MRLVNKARSLQHKLTDSMLSVWLGRYPGVTLGRAVRIQGRPLVHVDPTCELSIGAGTLLNSRNDGYHLNMFAPVKLLLDADGAKITIGESTRIHGSCIHARESIEIGDRCLIAANCQIIDSNGHDVMLDTPEERIHSRGNSKAIIIEDDVWIGAGSIILPGVRIGRGSVIGAMSVVSRDVPEGSLVGGNPAQLIRSVDSSP